MYVEPPIIDCHCHVFTARMPLTPGAWAHPAYEYPVQRYLADLDAHGVAFGVITAASLYGDYNDYTLEALSQHRRLRATVWVEPGVDRETLRRYAEQGVTGVRLQWGGEGPDLQGFEHRSLLRRLADLGLHVELNVPGDQLGEVIPALEANGVRIMVDHFGLLRSPRGMESEGFAALLEAVQRGSTWVKISAGFRVGAERLPEATERLLREAGPERLVWGSDAPFVGWEGKVDYAWTVRAFQETVSDPAVRRAISDTGLRFYFM